MLVQKTSLAIFDIIDDVEAFLIKENVMDELRLNFIQFKINEYKNRFELINPNYKEEVYHIIQENFRKMNLNISILNELPDFLSNFYLVMLFSDFQDSLFKDITLHAFNQFNNDHKLIINSLNDLNSSFNAKNAMWSV